MRVLKFWFEETTPEQRFKKDPDFDALIRDRFRPLYDDIRSNGHERFLESADTILAAIIVLDQFSRNMFRDQPEAFAEDSQARGLTKHAIEVGFDQKLASERRVFCYMPLMHSEDLADQDLSLKVFGALGNDQVYDYAVRHRDIIEKFGRFPHRNAVLGRDTTDEEKAHLEEHGGF